MSSGFKLDYRTTFQLMKAYHKLGVQKCRIVEFLYDRSVFHGGYTDLTFALGLNRGNVSNIRKAVIELSKIGVVYLDRGPRAEYDDDGVLLRSTPMVACFLVDGWFEYLMRWYNETEPIELCTFADNDDDYCKVFHVTKEWLIEILERFDDLNNRTGVDLDNFLENYTWNETECIYEEAKATGNLLGEEIQK